MLVVILDVRRSAVFRRLSREAVVGRPFTAGITVAREIERHVHLAVSVPPALTISEWIGELKGASAHYVNHEVARRRVLEWQSGIAW